MITDAIKSQIDQIWNAFGRRGVRLLGKLLAKRRLYSLDRRRAGHSHPHDLLPHGCGGEVLVGLGEARHRGSLSAEPPDKAQNALPRKAKGPGDRTEALTPARNPQPT